MTEQPATPVGQHTPRPPRPSRRWVAWAFRFATLIAGLAVGLFVAEVVFRNRAGGAFPHVNFYTPDRALGVRLEPHASEKIAFGGNPITSLRTNSVGYRGGEWPAPSADAVLVVGDSQVFGLGVEESDTFSAQLATALRRPVINAGVPTYGPAEYRAVIIEQLARKPGTVVLTLNMVNDLFELAHPNVERHAVWDGWAVRKESAPDEVLDLPGRRFLFRESHLMFAFRKWWNKDSPIGESGFASEGTWHDLVTAGEGRARIQGARAERLEAVTSQRRQAQADLVKADAEIERALRDVLSRKVYSQSPLLNAGRANPGDIVEDSFAESSRGIVVTADLIRRGVALRAELRAELAAWTKTHADDKARSAAAALDARSAAMAKLAGLDPRELERALESPLATYVREVAALCAEHGARLVVVVLPIDVQVSPTEWAKYGVAPTDMSSTKVLTAELIASAKANGISALDAAPALAAAEPGAFLDRDIHMTAKGHAAVAAALAEVIAAPPPSVPVVRLPVPLPPVWREAPDAPLVGAEAAGCEAKLVGEWLRVLCGRTRAGDEPTRIAVETDALGESLALAVPHQTSLVTAVREGAEVVAQLTWSDHTRQLRITWPRGAAAATMAFDDAIKTPGRRVPFDPNRFRQQRYAESSVFVSPVERAICECWFRVEHAITGSLGDPDHLQCSGAYGSPIAACTTTYATNCPRMLECVRRDPASPP